MTATGLGRPGPTMPAVPLLSARGVEVVYEPVRGVRIWSVRGVDLDVAEGEFVGLVGESGCGKSTLGLALTRLLRPPARLERGIITFAGTDVATLEGEALRRQRRGGFALVPQSGMNALNPVRTVENHVADVLRAHQRKGEVWDRRAVHDRARELVGMVELRDDVLARYPHELSGGMRQRVAIALALALEPRLVVFDEPTTALDVLVQRAVIGTIKRIQAERGFAALLISHDLGTVLEATERTLVMYAGEIVEDSPSHALLTGSHHPYTEALLDCYADPRADEVHLGGIPGSPPDLSLATVGCPFAPRCGFAEEACRLADPALTPLGRGLAACQVRAREAGVTPTVRTAASGGPSTGSDQEVEHVG